MTAMLSGATFSTCRQYRYKLWRDWDMTKQKAVFVMLNPSTADEVAQDPTIERCQRRAALLGYGGLVVVNAFAWRSTDPRALRTVADPIGPDNDRFIGESVTGAGIVICGWGNHAKLARRCDAVKELIRSVGSIPHAFVINKDGSPKHPLYVAYDVQPVPMR